MLKCRDLRELPSLKTIDYVAGEEGLDRVIRWSYVTETHTFSNWVHGEELLIISGISQTIGYNLISLIEEAIKNRMAGALVLIGDNYETNIDDSVIEIANRERFPIMTISWKVPLVDILEDMGRAIVQSNILDKNKENIVSNIIFSESINEALLISECKLLDYDLECPQQMIMIQLYNETNSSNFSNTKLYDIDKKTHIINWIKEYFFKSNINALVSDCGSNIIIMCESPKDKEVIISILNRIAIGIEKSYKDIYFNIGVSSICFDISKIKNSFSEASKCISLLNKLEYKNKIYYYDNLGLYKLFMEIDKEEVLQKYYDDLLGPLIQYDKKNDTNLVESLQNYLEENCNIIRTSKKMFIHRNTLKYRIQRIEEITNKSLSDSHTKLEFQNALLIRNIVQ